jgi:SWI/SNF-related matrix-associated actin-dependent regulator of chromatin subfamily A-like protein 1
MRLVEPGQNVLLREGPTGGTVVVLAFPYDQRLVDAARGIPGRRFDWERREWWARADDWTGTHVADLVRRFPQLTVTDEARTWLDGLSGRWIGRVSTTRHGVQGWFLAQTRAGELPPALARDAVALGTHHLLPLTVEVVAALRDEPSVHLDARAADCAARLEVGLTPPPAILTHVDSVAGPRLRLDVLWDHTALLAFEELDGVEKAGHTLPIDPWIVPRVERFVRDHGVEVGALARPVLAALREEYDAAMTAVERSRAQDGPPLDPLPRLGGELEPFQHAGVRYVLEARRTFLADEQGLGKTIEALAALEADGAFPAVVVCPASLKLNWEREAAHWLPHRTRTVLSGRGTVGVPADITILNYEIVEAHSDRLRRARPAALVVDESHLVKNPRAQRTKAVRRLADGVAPNGLKLALTGTPVMNHPDELIAQLRVIDRLADFGSGQRFSQQFRGGHGAEERLHWHLRRHCFVRRTKAEVLPQLPAKRRSVLPVALTNEDEYRTAERDVIEWLAQQPLDLAQLDARIAAARRAERLAQLNALKQIAARGKLAAALGWIHDFRASEEPLVVFAHHAEIQEAVLDRFPGALHLLGRDSGAARDATVRAFQSGESDGLLVCSTAVAAQGITLTRATNVCFLELEWTPAMHDQAEDRVHRMGQRDAVTAWYLLAAGTIDETMARLIERKRDLVAAVTDGRERDEEPLVEAVVRELRNAPIRHLKAV